MMTSHCSSKVLAPKRGSKTEIPGALRQKNSNNVDSSSAASNHNFRNRRGKFQHPTLGYAIPPPQPAKVARRNARERNRVKQVNCGFEMLRSHIPSAAKAKKMSKVDTLRHAVEYIQNLQKMLAMESNLGNQIESSSNISEDSSNQITSCATIHEFRAQDVRQHPQQHPQQQQHGQHLQQHHGQHHGQHSYESSYFTFPSYYVESTRCSEDEGVVSSSSSPVSPSFNNNVLANVNNGYYGNVENNFYGHEADEDELLDAIAKWQEQD